MPKDRGIEEVDSYLGDFTKVIAERVKKKGNVRILDAGCGYGVAMMGFIKRFGSKVKITGFNYSKYDGHIEKMKKEAIKKKIFTKEEINKITNLPKIVYCDASKKLPFQNNSFDFIYSMASLYLYNDKIHFLEECNRILDNKGIARISSVFGKHKHKMIKGRKKDPKYYQFLWEIWDKGKEAKIWNYCNKIKGVRSIWKNRNKGDKPMYIEIKNRKNLILS